MNLVQHIDDYGDNRFIRKNLSVDGSLITVKYSKKAFFAQAWNQYPVLLQARGHTFDAETGKIITRPFDKIFNYGENDAGLNVPDDELVIASKKINGFLAAVTKHPVTMEPILQTSGTACFLKDAEKHDNDFIKMAHSYLKHIDLIYREYTYLFEICHPNDPHVIEEKAGAHYLGVRHIESGKLSQYDETLELASHWWLEFCKFHYTLPLTIPKSELLKLTHNCFIEGFVVQAKSENFKIKSPHYLSHKFLSRASTDKLGNILKHPESYDEEIVALLNKIPDLDSYYLAADDQEKLKILREATKGNIFV